MPFYALEELSSPTRLGLVKDVLEDGIAYVKMIARMPYTSDCDDWIAQAARVSTQSVGKDREANIRLLRRLMKDGHTSPFEQVIFTFELRVPLFVREQLVRQRTARLNVESARYREIKNEFFFPPMWSKQSKTNKQGGVERQKNERATLILQEAVEHSHRAYNELLSDDISREQARFTMPMNHYGSLWFNLDLHNLMKFFAKRCAPDAQYETRQVCLAMEALVAQHAPESMKAWMETLPDATQEQISSYVLYPEVGGSRSVSAQPDTP